MKEMHYLTNGTVDSIVKRATMIKASGMKCVDVGNRDLVETATGNKVMTLMEVVFEGNWFQWRKAKRIINKMPKSQIV